MTTRTESDTLELMKRPRITPRNGVAFDEADVAAFEDAIDAEGAAPPSKLRPCLDGAGLVAPVIYPATWTSNATTGDLDAAAAALGGWRDVGDEDDDALDDEPTREMTLDDEPTRELAPATLRSRNGSSARVLGAALGALLLVVLGAGSVAAAKTQASDHAAPIVVGVR